MALARADSRWPRAVLFGLLAEITTIIAVIAVVTAHSVATGGPMIDMTSRFATVWGAGIGIVGGAFFVYLFARWIGALVSQRHIAHGLVAAAAAVLLHVAGSLHSPENMRWLQIGADALKLAAGALGGWVSSRYS
jgi:hypothetical protein